MGTRLRILHVDPERSWSGGEVQVLGLARHLLGMGHEVGVASDPGGALRVASEEAGIAFHPLRVRNSVDLLAGSRLRRLAASADVVHLHTARALALAPWLRSVGGARLVTRRMDYRPSPASYTRLLYNHCVDRVVAISEGIRDVLVSAGVDPERISVIRSGVEPERFANGEPGVGRREEEGGWPEGGPLVVVVGALVPRKGHAVLLEAAKRLAANGLSLRYAFCGEGESRGALEAAVRRAGFGDRVRFLGWRRDVERVLAEADLVAMPSLKEGLGVAALEAMAAGRAVVASRVGGLAEVVLDGETGWLVPPADPEALAGALAEAVREPARVRRYGSAARRRAVSEFSMEGMARANEALYRQILQHVSPARSTRAR